MTVIEKILTHHTGYKVKPNDIVLSKVDFFMAQDGTAPLMIETFEELNSAKKRYNLKNLALIIDHNSPAPSEGVANLHNLMREFAKKYNCYLFDIGEGICHQIMIEQGFVLPSQLIIGADSHTITYGALNCAACGVGSTDLACALFTGKIWLRVPETIKIVCNGKLRNDTTAKDLILYLIGNLGAEYCNYKAVEFTGDVINSLSIDSRLTITNMSQEFGAKFAIMYYDDKLKKFFDSSVKDVTYPDDNAEYKEIKEYDFSDLSRQVAVPHSVDNVKPVSELKGLKITQAFIGTCTNGRLEDLICAAKILEGKKVKTRLIISPASKRIYTEALKRGLIKIFIDCGAVVLPPSCACCCGTHQGIPADGENVISTANRNFKGRMGNPNANIYLASPITIARTAIKGEIN